jgi:hypothetical protein
MFKIIENAIPITVQNQLEEIFCSNLFPWYYSNSITIQGSKEDPYPGFSHMIKPSFTESSYCLLLTTILYIAADKAGIKVSEIERIRLGMFTNTNESLVHLSHIDLPTDHLVMLYYVIDSDGPTYFYDNNKNIIKTVEPKKGTVVFFRGDTIHSSSSPITSPRRIVINYNFNLGISYNAYKQNTQIN